MSRGGAANITDSDRVQGHWDRSACQEYTGGGLVIYQQVVERTVRERQDCGPNIGGRGLCRYKGLIFQMRSSMGYPSSNTGPEAGYSLRNVC